MDADITRALRRLIDSERVLTLAVLVDGAPVAALLPYAVGPDGAHLFVQASGLARHARGLVDGAAVGVAVHLPATPDRDPLQIPRLTVEATVRHLARGTEAYREAANRLAARFPAAALTLTLPDFEVFALALGRGRYVEGFARAVNVSAANFETPAAT
ncbi:MAG: pyridoxamine 5'-phosphate oxidase family protein [Vicinamibacterales bacterium]